MDSAIIRDKFIEYCTTRQNVLREPNYDCTEVAEDLLAIFPQGLVYKITINDMTFFKVQEYDQVRDFINHYVVVVDGLVLDPRFKEEPLAFDDYFTRLLNLNPDNANNIIISLDMKDFGDTNSKNVKSQQEAEGDAVPADTQTQETHESPKQQVNKPSGISLDFFKKD